MGNGNNFICLTLTQLLNASHTSQTHRGLKPTQPRRCWDCREGEAAFCSMCATEFITQRSSLHQCWRADSAGSKERIKKKKKSGSSWNNVKKKRKRKINTVPSPGLYTVAPFPSKSKMWSASIGGAGVLQHWGAGGGMYAKWQGPQSTVAHCIPFPSRPQGGA